MAQEYLMAARHGSRCAALLVVSGVLFGCDDSPSERYPGPWITVPSPAITRVMNQHGLTNCSDFAFRPSSITTGPLDPRGEFLVYCGAEGGSWTSWVVIPALARERNLIGPGEIYAGIPPPEG